MISNKNLNFGDAQNSIISTGNGRLFRLNTAYRLQTDTVPLVSVPNNLFFTAIETRVNFEYSVPVTGIGYPAVNVYSPRTEVVFIPQADVIGSQYVLAALPIEFTIAFLRFAGLESGVKSSETEGDKFGGKYSADLLKIFSGESYGTVDVNYEKSFAKVLSYYTDEKRINELKKQSIQLDLDYTEKLVGIEFFCKYKDEKMLTTEHHADGWMTTWNTILGDTIKKYFERAAERRKNLPKP